MRDQKSSLNTLRMENLCLDSLKNPVPDIILLEDFDSSPRYNPFRRLRPTSHKAEMARKQHYSRELH